MEKPKTINIPAKNLALEILKQNQKMVVQMKLMYIVFGLIYLLIPFIIAGVSNRTPFKRGNERNIFICNAIQTFAMYFLNLIIYNTVNQLIFNK